MFNNQISKGEIVINLPINDNPILDTYNFESLPYSIISSDKQSNGWEANNYIMLVMQKYFQNKPVPFGFYLPDYRKIPGLDCITANREFINKVLNVELIEFISNSLKNGWYIYLNLNDYYIPDRKAYSLEHNSHDFLVYGIDLSSEEILLFGYSKRNKLEKMKISINNFIEAYYSLDAIENNCCQVELFKLNTSIKFKFDLKLFVDTLTWYLKGIDISCYNANYIIPENLVFGVDCYNTLVEYYEQAKYDQQLSNFHNFKIPNKIVEHKRSLQQSTEYINSNILVNQLNDELIELQEIIRLSEKLKIFTIKYSLECNQRLSFIQEKSFSEKCIQLLKEIQKKEVVFMENIIRKCSF